MGQVPSTRLDGGPMPTAVDHARRTRHRLRVSEGQLPHHQQRHAYDHGRSDRCRASSSVTRESGGSDAQGSSGHRSCRAGGVHGRGRRIPGRCDVDRLAGSDDRFRSASCRGAGVLRHASPAPPPQQDRAAVSPTAGVDGLGPAWPTDRCPSSARAAQPGGYLLVHCRRCGLASGRGGVLPTGSAHRRPAPVSLQSPGARGREALARCGSPDPDALGLLRGRRLRHSPSPLVDHTASRSAGASSHPLTRTRVGQAGEASCSIASASSATGPCPSSSTVAPRLNSGSTVRTYSAICSRSAADVP